MIQHIDIQYIKARKGAPAKAWPGLTFGSLACSFSTCWVVIRGLRLFEKTSLQLGGS